MAIYYFMMEAIPNIDNPEKDEFKGAFVNCWVDSTNLILALSEATNYISSEGWTVQKVEDQFIDTRERHEEDPERLESLVCFDQALEEGISAIFYVWETDED